MKLFKKRRKKEKEAKMWLHWNENAANRPQNVTTPCNFPKVSQMNCMKVSILEISASKVAFCTKFGHLIGKCKEKNALNKWVHD